jgi:hypothetical protein
MKLRRMVAVAAAALVIAPVVMRAQEPVEDGSETELRLSPFAGTGHYTDCSGAHSVQYGGLGASFEHRPHANDTVHVRVAGAMLHEHDALNDGSGTNRTVVGALGQVGGDWTHFGFVFGVGMYPVRTPNVSGTYVPLPTFALRFGNRQRFHVVFSVLDDPSFVRSVVALDAVTVLESFRISIGIHASPVVTAAPLAVVQLEGRFGTVTLGAGGGVSLAEPASVLGHLTLGMHF